MKKNIKYILVFLLLFFLADKLIGYVSYHRLKSPQSYFYGQINKAILDTSKVFILGSSRAECHYNSKRLRSLYGKSVFNAGAGGYGIFYSYAILKERIKLNKPEIVILDIEPTILSSMKQFTILSKLQPLSGIYPAFNEVVQLNPDFKPFLMFFDSYRYNSTTYNFIAKDNNYDGFNPRFVTMDKNAKIGYHDPDEFSEEQIKNKDDIYRKQLIHIDKISAMCKQNNIKLYFVTSPALFDYDKDDILKAPLLTNFAKNGYKLVSYVGDKRFEGHYKMFKDQMHLNAAGADIFTEVFADTLIAMDKNAAILKK